MNSLFSIKKISRWIPAKGTGSWRKKGHQLEEWREEREGGEQREMPTLWWRGSPGCRWCGTRCRGWRAWDPSSQGRCRGRRGSGGGRTARRPRSWGRPGRRGGRRPRLGLGLGPRHQVRRPSLRGEGFSEKLGLGFSRCQRRERERVGEKWIGEDGAWTSARPEAEETDGESKGWRKVLVVYLLFLRL